MMTTQSIIPVKAHAQTRWAVQHLKAPAPWSAVVLTQPFPVPAERRPAYRQFVDTLLRLLPEAQSPYELEAFLQMDRIDHRKESSLLRDLGSLLGDYGLGYYPDQPPPTTWTTEEVLALFPPAKLRPLFYNVMRVQPDQASVNKIQGIFLGGGAFVRAFCAGKDVFYARATTQFKPLVAERKLRMFPYYAVQLTRHAIETADTVTMDAWTCGAQLYLRESNEDNGLLILRKGDLIPVFNELIHNNHLPDAEFLTGWNVEEQTRGQR